MPLLDTQDRTLQFKPKDSMPRGLFPVYLTGDHVVPEDSLGLKGARSIEGTKCNAWDAGQEST